MNPSLKKKGFFVKSFASKSLVNIVSEIIKKHFSKSTEFYCKLPINKFHDLALKCQLDINKLNLQKIFFDSEKVLLKKMFKNDTPMFSTLVTLRVVRPAKKAKKVENLGWHRETFYGKHNYIKHAINLWIPILNVNKNNTLKYIPNSHLIDDRKIKRVRIKDINANNGIKKFSSGHKLGFPYAPKKIVSGVNLAKMRNINVKKYSYIAFSQMLIHGNAQNLSNKIRFAVNLGFVPKSKLINNRKIDKRKFVTQEKNNKLYKEFV